MNKLIENFNYIDNYKLGLLFLIVGIIFFILLIIIKQYFLIEINLKKYFNKSFIKSKNGYNRLGPLFSNELNGQIFISWSNFDEVEVKGDTEKFYKIIDSDRPLNFFNWLDTLNGNRLEELVNKLRYDLKPFYTVVKLKNENTIEFDGNIAAGRPTLRMRAVIDFPQKVDNLANDYENLKIEALGLRAMLDSLAQPVWLRDRNGRLSWVNEAYAISVEAETCMQAVAQQVEFFESTILNEAKVSLGLGKVFTARVPTIVAGQRRIFEVVETPLVAGSIGYAADVTDLEGVRSDMQRQMFNHVRTLDQIPTAVAIFDESQQLVFCNLAYRKLWQLDDVFLVAKPTDNEILDYLRDNRRLPEQADYKGWKSALHEAYRSFETKETTWYLPSGRTLRVVINSNPQGGVTYLFEDLTAHFLLQSSFNSLSRVQSETLDSLNEGVAVFSTDGRLKLSNPAFEKIWSLQIERSLIQPHIDQIIAETHRLFSDLEIWNKIKSAVVGFSEIRQGQTIRMERKDGTTIDCMLAPLPDGATLLTFVDVSASVQIERALKDRNDALEQAAQLREKFVHHVSYQLRSPLTNVIGFTELLASGTGGELTTRQYEYVDHVLQSSNALMAIIDDILDLASLDRGEIILENNIYDIRDVVNSAIEGIKDRIYERKINIEINIDENIGILPIDSKRIRQIIFNLLSNAIGFSDDGQLILISIKLLNSNLIVIVRDYGRGIPSELIDKIFNRFETYTDGSNHRGAGLGLSIVKSLVELHGGKVEIESRLKDGTTVKCILPFSDGNSRIIEAIA